MKALFKAKAEPGLEIQDVEIPQIKDDEVLVKIRATSICGTDVHIWAWDGWAQKRIHPPLIVGHEFAGEVVELGKSVRGLEKGDLVSGETHINCGYCFQCKTGNAHICENVKLRGIDVTGCFAEYHAMPANTAWKNDKSIPIEVMSAQEPLGNAVHTVFSGSGTVAGQTVAIFGCGPIGMCAAALCKSSGAEKVYCVDLNDYRLNLAKEMGGDVLLNPLKTDVVKEMLSDTGGRGVDVVLEMSGGPEALRSCFKAVRPGGRVSILGVFPGEVSLDVTDGIVFKGVTVNGVNGRMMFNTWYKSASFLKTGKVDLKKIITNKFKLEEFEKAFQTMKSGNSGKIVMYP
ncbi:MAG: L-threonine 3-dehydrogenase [Candidatus Micrarchaeota archaeon]